MVKSKSVLLLVLCLVAFAAVSCSAGQWSVRLWVQGDDGTTVGEATFGGFHPDGTETYYFDAVDFGDFGRVEDLWLELDADPAVVMHFSFISGISPVQSFNGSAEMAIVPMLSVTSAVASGGVTLTEGEDTAPSATISGGYPNNKIWRATYNTTAPYADLVTGWSLVQDTETLQEICSDPILVPVDKIAIAYSFSLTDGDTASGTGRFRILGDPVPEPSGILAMIGGGIGMLGFAIRKRRS